MGEELIKQGGPLLAIGIGFAVLILVAVFVFLKYFYMPTVAKTIDKAYEQVKYAQEAREKDLERSSQAIARIGEQLDTAIKRTSEQQVSALREVARSFERLQKSLDKTDRSTGGR